jgi:hypothetical protein
MNVLPSPGVSWRLSTIEDTDTVSLGGHGVFTLAAPASEAQEFVSAGVVLGKNRREWLIGGTVTQGRAGRCFPDAEVLAALSETPFAGRAAIVAIPAAGIETDMVFALAVFAPGAEPSDSARITALLKSAIERAMGREFQPDHITVFPLFPRKGKDGSLDTAWCRNQYLRGTLFKKSRDPLYLNISRMRNCLWEAH